jgi:hypothetical protein
MSDYLARLERLEAVLGHDPGLIREACALASRLAVLGGAGVAGDVFPLPVGDEGLERLRSLIITLSGRNGNDYSG